MSLIGDPAPPARVTSSNRLTGFRLTVNGTIAARNFHFEKMHPLGIVITDQTTIAPAPDDLRGGLFSFPAPGGVLLDIERTVATDLRYLTFENPAGAASINSILEDPFLEMRGLIEPTSAIIVTQGFTDATGAVTLTSFIPPAAGAITGVPIILQMLALEPSTGRFRWSNAETFMILP